MTLRSVIDRIRHPDALLHIAWDLAFLVPGRPGLWLCDRVAAAIIAKRRRTRRPTR